jgi:hypothetical protein
MKGPGALDAGDGVTLGPSPVQSPPARFRARVHSSMKLQNASCAGETGTIEPMPSDERLPRSAVPRLSFAPEDKEKGLCAETRVHQAQDSVIIDLAQDVVDWQGIVDHRR